MTAKAEPVQVSAPAEEASYPKLRTAGFDARFPNVNQTRNCWQNYVDYFKCVKAKGEDFAPCEQFQFAYRSLCPPSWVFDIDCSKISGTSRGKMEFSLDYTKRNMTMVITNDNKRLFFLILYL
jgi:cytochrome c oxidase subunit 6b